MYAPTPLEWQTIFTPRQIAPVGQWDAVGRPLAGHKGAFPVGQLRQLIVAQQHMGQPQVHPAQQMRRNI